MTARHCALCHLLVLSALLSAAQAADPAAKTPAVSPATVHFVLVGDSTVTDKAGWGQAFTELLTGGARCTNAAGGGQSTKSFLDRGNWQKALALKPTHVLIQFGHNDQPGKGPHRETHPQTTYRANLRRYVDEARAAGAQPILVTSLTRRVFVDDKLVDTLAPYAEAVRAVAAENKVPLIDLYARSIEAVKKLGPVESLKLGPLTQEGKPDRTHLAQPGKELTARIVVEELCKVVPELADCFHRGAVDR